MPRALLLAFAIDLLLQMPTAGHAQEGTPVRLDRFGDPLPPGVLVRLGTLRFHRCSRAAYSPDGKFIVTGDSAGTQVWEAATGKKIRLLPGEDWGAEGLIFSHDGKKLAVLGRGGFWVQVWDLKTYEKTLFKQADAGGYGGDWSNATAFSTDDKTLVAATSRKLFIWDLASGKKLKEYPFRVKEQHVDIRMVAFSEDGKIAATQGHTGLRLWDTQTGQLLHEIKLSSNGGGDTMKFSRDGKALVVSGYGHWLKIYNVATGKKLPSLQVSERVVSLAFSPDGKTLAAASSSSTESDQVIQLWDLTNRKAPSVKHPAPGVRSVTFSPDGKTLAWCAYGQTLCFMDRKTGKDLRPIASHRGAIRSLVYLPDGKRIVSASEDCTIRIWDAATGKSLRVLRGHVAEVYGLAVFPNGKLLASCGNDGTVRLWDVERSKALAVRKDENNHHIVATAFSPDGKHLASGGYRGVLFLRYPANGKILEEYEARTITGLAFSPDSKTLAVLSDHGDKVLLHNLGTKKRKEIPVKRGGSSLAYSPDGKLLAVACNEELLLLDTATNRVLRKLPGHANRRGCVTFSPDGRYLASVTDGWGQFANRSIRIFEVATGTEIHSFKKELPVFAAAFSPDSSKLAIGGEDATAVILDLKNLTGKKRRPHLTEKELADHWESLGAADAAKAYEARADLLHAPQSAVPFLARHLRPAPAIDAKRVAGWIRSLNSNSFKIRNRAFKELQALGELAREPMRKALTNKLPEETRRRLESLLGKLDQPTPAQLRSLRGIEILEGIATPEALRIIDRLTRGNADGRATIASRAVVARRRKKNAPLPEIPKAPPATVANSEPVLPPGLVLPDLNADPMPAGAIARLGSTRWRLTSEPRRILVSPDGKLLAVVNNYSSVDLLDARTGRSIERAQTGFFNWGFDLRMAVALSADWQKVATLEAGERSGSVLAVLDRRQPKKIKIEYGRKQENYPVVPEELEEAHFRSSMTIEFLTAADFSPDGKTLVGCVRFDWRCDGDKRTKRVLENHLVAWNTATGKVIWKVLASAKEINTLWYSADGKTLTVLDQSGLGFWNAATGREVRRWRSVDPLFSARYSPDRKWLATGSKEHILLWDVATGKVRRRLALPGKEIKALAFSRDGTLLAGGGDKTIRFWDLRTGKARGDCSAFPSPVQAVAFSADGKTLFSGHEQENIVRRWDVARRKPSAEFKGPIEPLRMLAFSRDSRTLLATAKGEDFHLWEAKTGKSCPLPKKNDERFLTEWLASSGQAALLRCEEAFGQQFAMLLLGKVDRLDQIPGFLGSSVDGQRALIQSKKDKMPSLTVLKAAGNVVKGKAKRKNDIAREFIWKDGNEVNAALSPDGKTVVAAGNGVVCFFDVATGKERRYAHPTNVKEEFLFRTQSVKFSADGSRVALVGSGGKVRILAVHDGRRLAEFATKSHNVSGLAFSPDGQTLLTASFGSPVYAWEVATGQMVRRLKPGIYVYSPDNRLLARSAETLRVFDLYSGQALRECKAEGIGFGNFVFSPNSKFLAASCSDTTIVVWPTSATVAAPVKPWDEKGLVQILEKGGASEAYPAIGRMIADPQRALTFLERRLRAVPRPDARHVQRLLADLDSDQTKRRDAATKELARLGTLVEPALRAALASPKADVNSRARIEKLLHDLGENQTAISAEDLFHLRAIQALERIGTKKARQMLRDLARGAEMSPRTRAAVEALRRLEAH